MSLTIQYDNAISIATTAVRIPSTWGADFSPAPMQSSPGSEDQRTLLLLEQIMQALVGKPYTLSSLSEFASLATEEDTIQGPSEHHVISRLAGYKLRWRPSRYFNFDESSDGPLSSRVLCYRHGTQFYADILSNVDRAAWREFVLHDPTKPRSKDEQNAVYDVLGQLGVRRSLLSIEAQRRFYRVVLPWGTAKFFRTGVAPAEYLLIPVLTLTSARESSIFRRTLTLTLFLLPDVHESENVALNPTELATLCRQIVWLHQQYEYDQLGVEIDGPLCDLIGPEFTLCKPEKRRHLPDVIDALTEHILSKTVQPAKEAGDSVQARRTLAAFSRARSGLFATSVQASITGRRSVWDQITDRNDTSTRVELLRFLSMYAAPGDYATLLDPEAADFERMRVSNPYEPDRTSVLLYNPMSGYFLNVIPNEQERFPLVSAKWSISWLYLLMSSTCSIKEILRSYHYESEPFRSVIDGRHGPPGADASGKTSQEIVGALQAVQQMTVQAQDDIDLVYSFELSGPALAEAQRVVLEMEGVPNDRADVFQSLQTVTSMLRSRDIRYIETRIAKSAANTDRLTKVVMLATLIAITLQFHDYTETHDREFLWGITLANMTLFVAIALTALVVGSIIGERTARIASSIAAWCWKQIVGGAAS